MPNWSKSMIKVKSETMMVASTGHIKLEDNEWAKDNAHFKSSFSYLFSVPQVEYEENMPQSIAFLLGIAASNGYEWLMLDCDADVIEGIPSYDW